MKKVLILGVGAQGSTVAQRLDEEQAVSEIICADYDEKAVDVLVKTLKKAKGLKVDCTDYKSIVKAAQGVDLIVNALPTEFVQDVLNAALEVKASYQDFATGDEIDDEEDWVEGIRIMYDKYGKAFAKIGKTAIIGTGSAPGLLCVMASRAMRELDTCNTIIMMVYAAMETKKFVPFWWSPKIALETMMGPALACIDGEIVETESYSLPIYRKWPETDFEEVELVEHWHDEPAYMGINAEKYFKGAKNIYFKYGGSEIEFSKPFYKAGLISYDPVTFKGKKIVPVEFIEAFLPPAPKFKEEIQEIIDGGILHEAGATVCEAYGTKDGKKIMVDIHVNSLGLEEAFEKSGLTSEMYLTGQCGFFFTKMLVEDKFKPGLISTDMLDDGQVDYYLNLAAEKEITLSIEIKDDK